MLSVCSESSSRKTPWSPEKCQKNAPWLKNFYLQEFLELEAHIFILFSSHAETFKNALFPLDFENGYPTPFVSEGGKMTFFAVDIYVGNWSIPYVNINSEKEHFPTFGYENGGVPVLKIKRKECIFERFSTWTKNSENMSF